jgi:predicted transcriptional regulator of viral defense system
MTQEHPSQPTPALMLVRRLAAEGCRIFSTEQAREIAPDVGLSEGYVRQALHHLARAGWLVRLRKGLYALSSSVPGVSPAHEFEVAMALVHPAAISHFSAMHYHELTDQIPHRVFVMTTTGHWVPRSDKARNGESGYRVGETVYQFIQVKPERFFGTKEVWIGEARVTVTDMERTLIDGLAMPQCCGGFAEVIHAFAGAHDRLNLDRLIEYALKLNAATAKRLGWVLEKTETERSRLTALERVEVTGYSKLDPTGPRRGPYNRSWMIQENLAGKVTP